MIICFGSFFWVFIQSFLKKNNFIFVHVYRTGGSSIERTFGGTTNGMPTHTKLETIPNWEQYFSFGFVRNPWDRLVSSYMYLTTRKKFKGTFPEHVRQFTVGDLRTSKQYAQYNMLKNCSYIGRFEHLRDDFNEACKLIGIPTIQLPHVWKTNHKPYTEMYTDELKGIVGGAMSGDIAMFGVDFEGTATKNVGLVKESR